ncbi:MAG: hypothetical protein Kow0040_28540 [Thermogutta sp.]
MSESAEVPEKKETPDAESPQESVASDLSLRASRERSDADGTDEETANMLLELPEDELLDLPEAEGVTVTNRTQTVGDVEATDVSPSPTIEEDVLDRTDADSAGDTDILARDSVEADESQTPVEESSSEESLATLSGDESTSTSPLSENAASATADEQNADASTEAVPAASESTEAPILVRAPEGADVFALSELILEPSGRPLGPVAARWIGRLLEKLEESATATGETDEPAIAAWIRETAAPAIRTGEAPAESEETFVFAGPDAAEETSVRNRLKGNGKKKSLLRELVGIVLGGLGGLLIAYYALNWFGGPQYDFANIPLPGVRHTYRHAPPWLKPYLQPGKSSPPAGADAPSSQEL